MLDYQNFSLTVDQRASGVRFLMQDPEGGDSEAIGAGVNTVDWERSLSSTTRR